MRSVKDVAGAQVAWVQPVRAKEAFELRTGDEVVGTLVWSGRSLATADTADGRWTFKREGFLHPRVTVRVPGSDDNVAVFHPGWTGGGTLDLGSGRQIRFVAANFWRSRWQWLDGDAKPLIHFNSQQGALRLDGEVELEAGAAESPHAALMLTLGWYLINLTLRDATETAAVVASMGGASH